MDDSELDSATRSSSTSVRAYIRPCLMSSCVAVALLVILSLVVLLPVFYDTLSTDEDMQVITCCVTCTVVPGHYI